MMIQTSNSTSSWIFFGSLILLVQNLSSLFYFVFVKTTTPWFRTDYPPIFYLDLFGFFVLAIGIFRLRGASIHKEVLLGSIGILGWIAIRLIWQLLYQDPILPYWAYGFLTVVSYDLAINRLTIYLYFLAGSFLYLSAHYLNSIEILSEGYYSYCQLNFASGLLYVLPWLIITEFIQSINIVMAILFIFGSLAKLFAYGKGFPLFYRLVKSHNPFRKPESIDPWSYDSSN